MEPEEDTDSDVDSEVDDNHDDDTSLNFYEEVLNLDGYNHRYQTDRNLRRELNYHPTTSPQSSCYLLTDNDIVEKKKLRRMTKSNPPQSCNLILLEKPAILLSQNDKKGKTKYKGLKKTLSAKI